jgi:multiple antibiotic resistance protein
MLESTVLYITSLFTMINPLGVVPIFIALTARFSPQESRNVALKAGFVSFATLVLFAISGKFIFDFFGISVHGLKVVGGVLFFFMGYEMMRGRTVPKRLDAETNTEFGDEIAITPLAIPMITGPGAITMVLIMMQGADSMVAKMEIFASILVVMVLTTVILIGGRRLMAVLGPSGSKVMMRLMGLIVMLIAVEFFFAGVTPYIVAIAEAARQA